MCRCTAEFLWDTISVESTMAFADSTTRLIGHNLISGDDFKLVNFVNFMLGASIFASQPSSSNRNTRIIYVFSYLYFQCKSITFYWFRKTTKAV